MRHATDYLKPRYDLANAAADRFEDACYEAGFIWGRSNDRLPRFASVNGCSVPVVRSSSLNALAFVRGWRAARAAA